MAYNPALNGGFKKVVEDMINFRGIGNKPDNFRFGTNPTPVPQPLPAHTPGQVTVQAAPVTPAPAPAPAPAQDVASQVEAARKPIDWTKVRGVPVINKQEVNYSEVTPTIDPAQEEANRLKNVAFQNQQDQISRDVVERGRINDVLEANASQQKMLDAQAAGAMAMINGGTLSGMIQGQAILDNIAQLKTASSANVGTATGALINQQDVEAKRKASQNTFDIQQGQLGLESSLTPSKISLMQAQANLANQQGTATQAQAGLYGAQAGLAKTEAEHYMDTINAKYKQLESEQADKNMNLQTKMMDDISKMASADPAFLAAKTPQERDAILKQYTKLYLNNLGGGAK